MNIMTQNFQAISNATMCQPSIYTSQSGRYVIIRLQAQIAIQANMFVSLMISYTPPGVQLVDARLVASAREIACLLYLHVYVQ